MRMSMVTAMIRNRAAEQPQSLRHRWRRREMNSAAKGVCLSTAMIGGVNGDRGFSCSLLSAMAGLLVKREFSCGLAF